MVSYIGYSGASDWVGNSGVVFAVDEKGVDEAVQRKVIEHVVGHGVFEKVCDQFAVLTAINVHDANTHQHLAQELTSLGEQ